ncbi:MAG: threonine synthase [Nitrospirae bacterium]|nr:MAG: threonine synthase [Nitrospirota bacterium]
MPRWRGVIDRYKAFLPVTDKTPVVTLIEGNTPLIRSLKVKKATGLSLELYFKFEGANPTGSFKDRGMTMAISKALEENSKAVICASTGNTSASAAAYSARAGLLCIVLIPSGKIAIGKLAQAMIHGAMVLQIDGNFDVALDLVRRLVKKHNITLVNSINPYRLEGQKTAAFEICDQLGAPPDYHALPVGNAGNITAYWKGFKEYLSAEKIERTPKMLGFQAAGAAPIVEGHPIEHPETIATAIRIGNPASWKGALNAVKESNGRIDKVTDEEILEAYKFIASEEGIFCEPASAASFAGVIKLSKEGFFKDGERVVCTLTGHGLKDTDTAMISCEEPQKVEPELPIIESIIKDRLGGII